MAALIGRTGRVAAGAVLLVLAAALVRAQDAPAPATRPAAPAGAAPPGAAPDAAAPAPVAPDQPAPALPPSPDAAPPGAAEPATAAPESDETESPRARAPTPADPTRPVRSPVAILRVLDKVSAQSMAFAAPIGQRVRYKSLVFEVKACETLDPHEPEPRTSAYLLITSDAGASAAGVLGPRQVFKGWMFADSPSVRPFRHPVYDAWLVACAAAPPV